MELSKLQYEYIVESIKRFRLTVQHKIKIFNDNDLERLFVLKDQLGIIDANNNRCRSCDPYSTAVEQFSSVEKMVTEYESKNGK